MSAGVVGLALQSCVRGFLSFDLQKGMKDSHYTQGIRSPSFKDLRYHKYFTVDVR